jgi:hypothetical protein
MNPHYLGEAGMFFLRADKHPKCISCKEWLVKRHGLVQDGDGHLKEPHQVIGWFLGHSGPRCMWCHKEAWTDQEFWQRTGSVTDTAYRWQGDIRGQFDEQALAQANKLYPEVPRIKRDTLE